VSGTVSDFRYVDCVASVKVTLVWSFEVTGDYLRVSHMVLFRVGTFGVFEEFVGLLLPKITATLYYRVLSYNP